MLETKVGSRVYPMGHLWVTEVRLMALFNCCFILVVNILLKLIELQLL